MPLHCFRSQSLINLILSLCWSAMSIYIHLSTFPAKYPAIKLLIPALIQHTFNFVITPRYKYRIVDKGFQASHGICCIRRTLPNPTAQLTATVQTFFRQCLLTRTFNPVYRVLVIPFFSPALLLQFPINE